jgi:SAM-dependent methyltransferase
MTQGGAIIGLADWLRTPAGHYLLDWEQEAIDAVVADVFGFHALQLGLPQLDGLAANRMPHRWLAVDRAGDLEAAARAAGALAEVAVTDAASPVAERGPDPADADLPEGAPSAARVDLHCEFDALPFDAQSLDLVLLPHALELARDPHLALAEVERVLRPEGKVVILGFNPASLWGLRQRGGRLLNRLAGRGDDGLFLPTAGEFIGYRRLRDWLRLLSFEVEDGRFGCYRPALRSRAWLSRWAWMEEAGDRWWPVFGAVYLLVAVKRVRGMRLVGLARSARLAPKAAPAVVVQQRDPLTRVAAGADERHPS